MVEKISFSFFDHFSQDLFAPGIHFHVFFHYEKGTAEGKSSENVISHKCNLFSTIPSRLFSQRCTYYHGIKLVHGMIDL